MIAVAEKPSLLTRFRKVAIDQLNVLSRMPQGAPQIDTQAYPDNCGPGFPFHFDFYLASNLLTVNRVRLSFFLRAFRTDYDFSVHGTSAETGHSHSHNHTSAAHSHSHQHNLALAGGGSANTVSIVSGALNAFSGPVTDTSTVATDATGTTPGSGGTNAAGSSGHTHTVTGTDVVGITEWAVATGVTVKVNGTDRTSALGGGSGFTSNQTELALALAWLNLGAWNTIDLTPSGLGRITGHLTVVSFIQSA
jgi:hypothetical protein